MSWQPDPSGLQELVGVLRNSTSADTQVQAATQQRLTQFQSIPDFTAYLVHILIHPTIPPSTTPESESTRAVAGLVLKNSIQHPKSPISEEAWAYVKSTVLLGMGDESQMVRQTVGTVVCFIINSLDVGAWPEGLVKLMTAIDSTDKNEQEGAFNSISKLAEDCPEKLDCEINGQRPLTHLMQRFLVHTEHPEQRIRVYALTCLKNYVLVRSQSLMIFIDDYLQALFRRASDPSSDVRSVVCQSLVLLLSIRPDKIIPEIKNVAEYMLYSARDADEQVALEASEFWLTFGETPELVNELRPWLPQVGPLLLSGMVYSQSDLDWLGATDEADENVPDRAEDIKPRNFGKSSHGHEHQDTNPSPSNGAAANGAADDDEDEESDYYDSDDDEDPSSEWNLRKCSAAALDVMALNYGDDLLQILLPTLRDKLFSVDWLEKESGILALGAIAEGCIDGIQEHLPTLVPYLVTALQDPKPLVRSITCWTIGRYANWCVTQEGEAKEKFFVPVLEGLLRMVLDPNKKVQEAGCSAFATLEEEAGTALEPYLHPILTHLVMAFNKYQQKNLLILYDAIGTLADSVGAALSRPEYLQILMPPLIDKWMNLTDDDLNLVPLLECLSSVTIAASTAFVPYAQPVFQRCIAIIQSSLLQWQAYEQDPDTVEEPDKSFVVVALDLLSGLCQGLGGSITELVNNNQPSMMTLMTACLNHPEPSIRQSALALLGDVAIASFESLLKPALVTVMPLVMQQIELEPSVECVSVCNNATWAVGEIALGFGNDPASLEQFVVPLIQRLIPILLSQKSPRSLMENAAVAIGRIGLVCPAPIAPHLNLFARQWCVALWEIKDNDEKDSAFRGFCMLIQANPAGVQKDFMWFCNAVCKWMNPSPELQDMFGKILNGFKQMLGEAAWQEETKNYPPVLLNRLKERYQV